jgi:hypothetical protein
LGLVDCLSTQPQCGIERDFVEEKSRYAFPFFGRSIGFLLLAKRQSRRVYDRDCGQPGWSCSSTSMRGSRPRKYASTHFSFRRSLPATRFYDNVFTRMIYIVVCCNCIWCARLHTEVDMLQPQKRCMGCMVSICEFYSCFVRRNCMWNPGDHGSSLVV